MSSWEGAAAEKSTLLRQLKSVLAPAGEKEGGRSFTGTFR